MAISQVSKGVYVISPNQVKKYKDSAAGEYTSVFTKERAEQWQMAQKQAALELELGTKQYAEEMKTYRARLNALDTRRKELEGLKVRVAEGRLDASDASAIAAMREAGDRQKTAADFEAKKAEVMSISPGSTTTTTGGGGGAGTVGAPISSGAQTAAVTFEQTTRGQTLDAKMQAMARETGTGGTIPTTGAADRVNARGSIADRAIASRSAELEKAGQSPADARLAAEREALTALSATDPVAAREVSDYLSSKSAGAPAAGGGGPVTRTTTRPADVTTLKRPGLGELPPASPVTSPAVEGAAGIIGPEGLIASGIAGIEAERAGLARPSMAGFDYITRAREVAAGRFGPTPASSAFGQRNALDALLRADPSMRSAIMESFSKASVAAPQGVTGPTAPSVVAAPATTAPAVPAPAPATEGGWESVGIKRSDYSDEAGYQAAKVAWSAKQADIARAERGMEGIKLELEGLREGVDIAPGKSAETLMAEAVDTGAAARIPGLSPGGQSDLQRLADTKFAEAERRMAVESRIGAETAAAERPFQIPFEQRGGETVPFFRQPGGLADTRAMEQAYFDIQDERQRRVAPLRPEAADLMTEAERAQFMEDLRARRGPSPIEVAKATSFAAPRRLPPLQRPQMVPPAMTADSVGTVRVPSGVIAPSTPGAVGRYTPGPGPAPVVMAGPSTAAAAPVAPAAAPPGALDRQSRGGVATMQADMAARAGAESTEATTAAKKQLSDIKAAGAVDVFRGPKTGPGQTKEGYLLNRLEGAYMLAKKGDKLGRVSASGPGKVAYDLYVANRAKGIPFARTYEEITLTFSGDMPAMERAHETALALDIKDRDTAPGGK